MIGLLHTSSALSQSFASYYKAADGLKKEELKTALHKITAAHTTKSYNDLWNLYETTDACLNNEAQVFDMFSTETFYFVSVGNKMNKEHVVPQSWWGGGSKYPIYSDLLNVYPSETNANSRKSNYPLGKITGEVNFDNGRIKVGKSSNSGGCGYVVEPYDEFKGDFARIYLYDATCYQNISWDKTAYAFPTGVEEYPTLEKWIIPILLEWNRLDPPSEWEKVRNQRVQGIQGNRNPYIDYPQLAEYVWGDSINYSWDLATAIPYSIGGTGGKVPADPEGPEKEDDTPSDNPNIPDTRPAELIFTLAFDDIIQGNNISTGGSSTVWNATDNDLIVSATQCYCAGGALRMGSSKNTGSITTASITAAKGSNVKVEIDVKGWTTVEGGIIITVEGMEEQALTYKATINDSFETLTAVFDNIPIANPTITIATSTKRCFLDALRVYSVEDAIPNAIHTIVCSSPQTSDIYYDLSGRPINGKPQKKGLYIRNGKKVMY